MGDEAAQQQPPSPASSWPKDVRVDVIDGGASSSKSSYRLWRVPKHVRAINEEAYGPKFVCIGPYHRPRGGEDDDDDGGGGGGSRLRVEKLKKRYLDELLNDVVGPDHDDRTNRQEEILQRCEGRLWEILDSVRWFYAEDKCVREIKDEEMVQMLLHDGCFIIKHLYNFAKGYNEEELYETRWSPALLRIDLALLENQIPFFVLEEIFHHLTPRSLLRKITRGVVSNDDEMMRQRKKRTLLVMAMWYMLEGWFILPEDESDELYELIAKEEVHHLLHLVHVAHLAKVDSPPKSPPCDWRLCWQWLCRSLQFLLCIVPLFLVSLPLRMCRCCSRSHSGDGPGGQQDAKANIASASQLRDLGVKIRMVPRQRGGMLDVRVKEELGTVELEVPPLSVEQGSVQLLQNLVAYEQQGTPATSDEPKDYFTTYAFLMYNLVSTTEDIALLQEQRVLLNNFGSHETIIEFFKNLCRWNQRSEETLNTPIGKVLHKLKSCSHNRAYRDWAEAKKYMDSPVKILVLIVSTLLAISTVLQTTTALYPR